MGSHFLEYGVCLEHAELLRLWQSTARPGQTKHNCCPVHNTASHEVVRGPLSGCMKEAGGLRWVPNILLPDGYGGTWGTWNVPVGMTAHNVRSRRQVLLRQSLSLALHSATSRPSAFLCIRR